MGKEMLGKSHGKERKERVDMEKKVFHEVFMKFL